MLCFFILILNAKNIIITAIISIKYNICPICNKFGNAIEISLPYCKFDI